MSRASRWSVIWRGGLGCAALLDTTFTDMPLYDFRRRRVLNDHDVTSEWVLMHPALHEAHHEGQLALLGTSAQPSSA